MRTGASFGEDDGLGTDAAAGLEHVAAGRKSGVGMEEFGQCAGLILEPRIFFHIIPVDIRIFHGWSIILIGCAGMSRCPLCGGSVYSGISFHEANVYDVRHARGCVR